MTTSGEPFAVRLEVPARSEFLHLVRLNVAGALGDAGFGVEEIDDVKIAVEELAAVLLRTGDGADLAVTISTDEAHATVAGSRSSSTDAPITIDEFVETILDAVVDSHEVASTGSTVTFTLRKRVRGR